MDAIEKMIKELINSRKLNRARALLSLFYDEYPHLLFELEYAAGNYESAASIYEKLPDALKAKYSEKFEKIKDCKYKGSLKNALNEYGSGNIQGALDILENILNENPDLVEALAIKYEMYKKRGEKGKAKEIEMILKNLSPDHPVLVDSKKSFHGITTFFYITTISLLIFLTILTLYSLNIRKPVSSGIEERISNYEKMLNRLEAKIDNIEKSLKKYGEETSSSIKDLKTTFYIEIDSLKSNVHKTYSYIERVEKALSKLNENIYQISKQKVEKQPKSDLKYILMPGEEIYSPSTTLDFAKITWLAGYIMFLKGRYEDAINLFKKSLDVVEVFYPKVYFRDDCEYYLALAYYFKGDKNKAKVLFEKFVEKYPLSQYADDAELFLKRLASGGE